MQKSPAWQALDEHSAALSNRRLADIILADPNRLEACAVELDGLRLNYALQRVMPETIALLAKLAEERDLAGWRERLLNGEKINTTENRAVLHMALRQSGDNPVLVDGKNVIPQIRKMQEQIADFTEAVRDGTHRGATGRPIKHVVNIGIGGSDLGPRLATQALSLFANGPEVHFVANADAFELTQLFKKLDPAETLFVVVSKTFTTQETLLNARTARTWLVEKLGEGAVDRHFAAVSTNLDAIRKFGIADKNTFPMWDWVGGRFSLWSAVGLALVLAIGWRNFKELLRGAEAMDNHFKKAPSAQNLPVLLAMLGIWSRNFQGYPAHVVLPYSERLRDMPRYLQQLEMESNGKSVARDGKSTETPTTPILFGEPGTVGQHGFHQWLHQGSDIVSADFIGVAEDDLKRPEHHQALLANMVAQAGAFAFGQTKAPSPQDIYAGDRPSTLIMLKRLDPFGLGMLLALYEHKVFTQSVIWNINPFDQPGVELGKRMARSLADGSHPTDPQGLFLAQFYAKIVK